MYEFDPILGLKVVKINDESYLTGASAGSRLGVGRNTFYKKLRELKFLYDSNEATFKGKAIGIVDVRSDSVPDFVPTSQPHFSLNALNELAQYFPLKKKVK